MSEHLIGETTKHVIDAVSVATAVSTLTAWLPPVAALFTIIWTCLRLVEMITGKTIADLIKGWRT